jgi:hypothetical protein
MDPTKVEETDSKNRENKVREKKGDEDLSLFQLSF